jgi:peptidoglycan/LPS O-acetylase OafA/YrhL
MVPKTRASQSQFFPRKVCAQTPWIPSERALTRIASERGYADVRVSPTYTGVTSSTASRPSATHLPGLDGVRAIAVLMVLLHHSLYQSSHKTLAQNILRHITGQGWVGVDLFFVLSGFLITGILMDVRVREGALRNFSVRRMLRIVPVYVTFLLFCLWVAPAAGILTAAEAAQLHETQLWYWTYSVNLLIASHSWSVASFPVVHLWSLAVEEQFYLLWPLAALSLSARALKRAAIGCILAAELCRIFAVMHGWGGQFNYVMLPARMDSLAAGALLACAFRDPLLWARVLRARRATTVISLIVLAVIIGFKHTIANQDPLEQLIAFPALVALASVVVATAVGSVGWLTNNVLRLIGKISYGMYVWHVLVIRVISNLLPPPELESSHALWFDYGILVFGTLIGSLLVAALSWYVIESPILRLKRLVPSN